jgi:diguanylate cyclase (GGDEF)-like protein/PAS domain S-box-containing protein
MNTQQIFGRTWTRYIIAIALVAFAAILRIWPLQSLESSLAWLTFYPAVMMAAIYGGLISGLLATGLSGLIVTFLWPLLVAEPFIKNPADWLGMSVFILTASMISGVAEAMRRAQSREKLYRTLFESMDEGFCVIEMLYDINNKPVDYRFIEINPAFEKHTGLQKAQGKTIRQIVPDHDAHWFELYGNVARTGVAARFENPAIAMQRHYDVFAYRIGGNGSNRVGILFNDISERKRAEELLRKSEERYRALFDNMLDGFAYCKILLEGDSARDFVYIDVNSSFEKLTGLKGVSGKKVSEVIPGIRESNPELIETYGRVALTGMAERFETYVAPLEIWFFVTVYSPEKEYFVAIFENITERKQAEEELRIAAGTFETHDAIMITDADAFIIKVNRAFTLITGYSPEEALGRNPRFMKSGLHDKNFYDDLFKNLLRDGKWEGEIWDKRKNGEIYPRWMTITAVKDKNHKTTQYVSIFSDITDRKKNEELINKLAFYDTLTQLPNRRMLNDRLKQAMAANKRSGIYGAVMFMDLDNFKPLNDTHGHVVGDLLLIEVGRRISSCVREVDTVARFGGDEFVVMLGELNIDKAKSREEAAIVAEKIRVCLAETYFLKLQQGDHPETSVEHHCSSSIGVTLFLNHETSQDDILKQADAAMYRAKESGRNSICFYEAGIE